MTLTRRTVLATPFLVPFAAQAASHSDPVAATLDRARSFGTRFHGLIVRQGDETLIEERLNGPALDRPVNVKSVSKSIVALLTGAAIDRGVIEGVGATLGDTAPRLIPSGADPRVADITIEDLLSLRAGLERTSGPNYGAWVSSRNWVADALSRPFVSEPGSAMLYSTGSTHVLGAALATAADASLLRLARDWLGGPLGIEIPAWTRDPQGFYLGGNEMALSVHAMARIGDMMRQGGLLGETRVLSADWLAQSLLPRTRSPFSGLAYGYGWFLGAAHGQDYALARGYGGQVISFVPGLDMTIAITSDPTQPARSGGYFGDLMGLIEDELIGGLA